MPSVNINFTYQPGEYARALRHVQVQRLAVRRDVVVAILTIIIGVYFWVSDGLTIWAGLLCGVGLVFLLMLAFAVLVTPYLVERSTPKLREQYQLSFADEGIRFKTTSIDAHLAWSIYSVWWDGPDYFFFFHGKRDVTIIPFRVLSTSDDAATFRELVTHQLGMATLVKR
ncbi:MAG: YcxB family protein [Deinococcota bacterium]